jgi:hypothetical protein
MQAVDRTIRKIFDAAAGPVSVRAAAYARRRRDAVLAAHGASAFRVTVDGRSGAAEETVSAEGGIIRYDFDYVAKAARFALAALRRAAPVRRGTYRADHKVLVAGRESAVVPDRLPFGTVITLVNALPYARKIERGLSKKAPDGVYEVVARQVRSRFGATVAVGFTWIQLAGGRSRAGRYPALKLKARAA